MERRDFIEELLRTIQPRESVMRFARLMEFKLRKNAYKEKNWPPGEFDSNGERDWSGLDLDYLMKRLEDEYDELQKELGPGIRDYDPIAVALECVDMGNFEMMIVDKLFEVCKLDVRRNSERAV